MELEIPPISGSRSGSFPTAAPQMQPRQSTAVSLALPRPLSSQCSGGPQQPWAVEGKKQSLSGAACAAFPFLFPPLLTVSAVRPMHNAITSAEEGESRPRELCLDPLYEGVGHCHKYHFADTVEKP